MVISLALAAAAMLGIAILSRDNAGLGSAWKVLVVFAVAFLLAASFYALSLPASSALTVNGINAGYINATDYINLPTTTIPAASLIPANIVSNTIYQNPNSTRTLLIYSVTKSAPLSAWLGSSANTLTEVVDNTGGSVTVSATVYSLAGYNMTALVVVPPSWYYKYNYTTAQFYYERS